MKDTDVRSLSLATELCGLHLKTPLIAASGTLGFGREYDELYEQPILNQNDSEPPEAEIRLDDKKKIRVLSPELLIWRRFVRNKHHH